MMTQTFRPRNAYKCLFVSHLSLSVIYHWQLFIIVILFGNYLSLAASLAIIYHCQLCIIVSLFDSYLSLLISHNIYFPMCPINPHYVLPLLLNKNEIG